MITDTCPRTSKFVYGQTTGGYTPVSGDLSATVRREDGPSVLHRLGHSGSQTRSVAELLAELKSEFGRLHELLHSAVREGRIRIQNRLSNLLFARSLHGKRTTPGAHSLSFPVRLAAEGSGG